MIRKKLPIGINGFEKIRTNDFYYVDKTMFFKELLQNWGEVKLFTRPKRHGKSLNMSMLKSFFEAGSDPGLYYGLKNMQEKELCEEYMGKFPVISISLKSVDGLDFKIESDVLKTVNSKGSKRFRFLCESPALDEKNKTAYGRLINMDIKSDAGYAMSDATLIDSLNTLSHADMGKGYSSIFIQTPERAGMLIEPKYADDRNLEKACREEVLEQIKERQYAEGLKRCSMK